MNNRMAKLIGPADATFKSCRHPLPAGKPLIFRLPPNANVTGRARRSLDRPLLPMAIAAFLAVLLSFFL